MTVVGHGTVREHATKTTTTMLTVFADTVFIGLLDLDPRARNEGGNALAELVFAVRVRCRARTAVEQKYAHVAVTRSSET